MLFHTDIPDIIGPTVSLFLLSMEIFYIILCHSTAQHCNVSTRLSVDVVLSSAYLSSIIDLASYRRRNLDGTRTKRLRRWYSFESMHEGCGLSLCRVDSTCDTIRSERGQCPCRPSVQKPA
jgi:hypothetical protein